jgi:hypothetical protein
MILDCMESVRIINATSGSAHRVMVSVDLLRTDIIDSKVPKYMLP